LGLSIELPLLHRNQGPIAEAEARRKASAARFEALQARLISEVDFALTGCSIAEKNLADAESFRATQKKQEEYQQQQVNAGATDLLDLLAARLELAGSELTLLEGRAKFHQAIGAVENAIQQPFDLL